MAQQLQQTTRPLNLAELKQPWIKSVIYGGTGVGKTVFCCQSQQFKTFVFDVDDGAYAASTWLGNPAMGAPATRRDLVDVWPVRSRQEFVAGFDYLTRRADQYQLVVVDTATELQRVVMREVTRGALPDQQAWGKGLNAMEELTTMFRHLNMHVIFAAHEIEKEDQELRRLMFRPSFQGAFGSTYARHFSLIARYCLIDTLTLDQNGVVVGTGTARWLNCERDQVTHAKNRGGGLDKWEPPVLDYIINKMVAAAQANPTVFEQQ